MDIQLTAQDRQLLAEFQTFVAQELPPVLREKVRLGQTPDRAEMVQWQQALHARGWATPHWPTRWGGPGWTAMQRYLFIDTLQQGCAPEPLPFNTNMVGPVLIEFGTPAQQERFLPRIARLDDWWCQGFSEPGSGSDLASLRTSAVRDGDHYVVRGQKIWTTMAQHADWMFALVRTDPHAKKQKGISFLLIDMKSPGITIRPIYTINGRHEVNEVFLDDVRVPLENLVGEENRGWDCAKFLLGNERTGQARVGLINERIRRAKTLATQALPGRSPLMTDPRFVERLTHLEIDAKALELMLLRVLAAHDAGGATAVDASLLKLGGSELRQACTELLLDMAGAQALRAMPAEKDMPDDLEALEALWPSAAVTNYYFNRVLSIFGGANEIQRNMVARAILEA